jgi:hypothetical protein
MITVHTGFVGAEHEEEVEFDDEMWEEWTEEQRERALNEARQDAIDNHVYTDCEELENE